MRNLISGVKTLIGFVTVLSAAIAVFGSFQPNIRDWLLAHAPAGWAAALVFAALLSVAGGVLRSKHQEVLSLRSKSDESDRVLLNELLLGWRQGDSFMEWLAHDFYPNQIPTDLNGQVDTHIRAWDQDMRTFTSPRLQLAFDNLRIATNHFFDIVSYNTWLGSDTHFAYLEMVSQRGDESYEADQELIVSARDQLLHALQDLFKVTHSEGLVFE